MVCVPEISKIDLSLPNSFEEGNYPYLDKIIISTIDSARCDMIVAMDQLDLSQRQETIRVNWEINSLMGASL